MGAEVRERRSQGLREEDEKRQTDRQYQYDRQTYKDSMKQMLCLVQFEFAS